MAAAHLRWVDDGGELVDAEHAQVADGEGAARELVRLQLPVLGLQYPADMGQSLGSLRCVMGDLWDETCMAALLLQGPSELR